MLNVFLNRRDAQTGLVPPFPDKGHWNFYEWRSGLDGAKGTDRSVTDLPLNALLSLALQRMAEIANALDIPNDYLKHSAMLNEQICHHFFDPTHGLCFDRSIDEKTYSTLGNALAVLCGAIPAPHAKAICERMISDDTVTPISVSMQCFLYDALLATDKARYAPYVLDRIEQTYRPMVERGLGTVWETELGEADFHNAGSLCHGWSAMPIYYYHTLLH